MGALRFISGWNRWGHSAFRFHVEAQGNQRRTRRCTEWRPDGAARQFASWRRAAIGELNVGRNDMLCEICHEREATVHNTEIADELQKSRDLCEQCLQAT